MALYGPESGQGREEWFVSAQKRSCRRFAENYLPDANVLQDGDETGADARLMKRQNQIPLKEADNHLASEMSRSHCE